MVPLSLRRGRQEERSHSPGFLHPAFRPRKRKGLGSRRQTSGIPAHQGARAREGCRASWTGSDDAAYAPRSSAFAGPPVQVHLQSCQPEMKLRRVFLQPLYHRWPSYSTLSLEHHLCLRSQRSVGPQGSAWRESTQVTTPACTNPNTDSVSTSTLAGRYFVHHMHWEKKETWSLFSSQARERKFLLPKQGR